MRKAKANYHLELVSNSFADPSKFWKVVNMNKNKSTTSTPSPVTFNDCFLHDPSEICQAFNTHFAAAGNQFDVIYPDNSLNNNPQDDVLPSYPTSQFSLHTVTSSAVKEALQTMDCRKATGEDHLNPYFLKLSAPIITNQITHLFNLSISTGVIPQVWKSAHVVPLHQGGDKKDINNYGPISKLSCLAKILESLVNNQLKSFLSSNSVLNPHQSGFRAKHSTVTATTLVINNITTAVDKGKYCAALFVDLSKAFDTVDHALLLQRLHDIGFDCNSCKWFQDYLSHRQQCVLLGNERSTFLPLLKGVPQGSILGPVLFSIYINNITSSITNCNAHLYADDTVLYCT